MLNFNSKISLVIPIYNELNNIDILYDEIYKVLNNLNYEYEIIFVDDGSFDGSSIKLNNLANFKNVIVIKNDKNYGQSYSIYQGVKKSNFLTIITLDGDLQNDPNDIGKLIDLYSSNDYHLVGGIRVNRKDNYVKIISSKIANYIRNIILKDGCVDTGCSLKVFHKEKFLEFPFFDGMHRFLPALFKGYGCKTFFTPVNHRKRLNDYSKYGINNRLLRGIKDLLKVKKILKVRK
jgi:dolichol-phosphate mannosyltransferase